MTDTARTTTPTHTVLGRFRLQGGSVARVRPAALAAMWRGAVGAMFPDDPDFHGHLGGTNALRYPPVQYRWIDGAPALYALGPAAQRAMGHPWTTQTVRLGTETHGIVEVDWKVAALRFETARGLLRYTFGAPWIALNQDNYAQYPTLSLPERRAMLDRVLVGNLLTMSRSLGWEHRDTVYAAFEWEGEHAVPLKDVSLLGFVGSFVTNLVLPDHLSLGRSVSHGYGWFSRG